MFHHCRRQKRNPLRANRLHAFPVISPENTMLNDFAVTELNTVGIHRSATLKSVSWGLGQVMSIHWRWLEYESVQALVESVRSGLAGQVSLMMVYIRKTGLLEAIRARDWAAFARGYSGPAYKAHGYDRELAFTWSRYAEEDLTSRGAKFASRYQILLLKFGDHGDAVEDLQRLLSRHGYFWKPDGDFGFLTKEAVAALQRKHGLMVDGIAGPRAYEVLVR
jgi:hypothetical protein